MPEARHLLELPKKAILHQRPERANRREEDTKTKEEGSLIPARRKKALKIAKLKVDVRVSERKEEEKPADSELRRRIEHFKGVLSGEAVKIKQTPRVEKKVQSKKEVEHSVIPKGIKLAYFANGPRNFKEAYNDADLLAKLNRKIPYSSNYSPMASGRANTSPTTVNGGGVQRARVVYDSEHVYVKYAKKNNFGNEKDISSFTEEDAN